MNGNVKKGVGQNRIQSLLAVAVCICVAFAMQMSALPALAEDTWEIPGEEDMPTENASETWNASFASCRRVGSSESVSEYQFSTENVSKAWKTSKADGKVGIAVLDTGVTMDTDYRNADLANVTDWEAAWDATTDAPLASDFIDYDNHETAVACAAAGEADGGTWTEGTSHNATIVPVRVFDADDRCYDKYLVAAMKHILEVADEENIRIIDIPIWKSSTSQELGLLMGDACRKGIVTIAAAGDYSPSEDCSEAEAGGDWGADISVGAVDEDHEHAWFSYHNKNLGIVAAGVDVPLPVEWFCTKTRDADGHVVRTNLEYKRHSCSLVSGTAVSSGIVAGIAALVVAGDSTLGAGDIREALTHTTRGSQSWDPYYGMGEIDAASAVTSVIAPKATGVTGCTAKVKRASGKGKTVKGAVKLTWEKVGCSDGYRLCWRKTGHKRWTTLDVSGADTTSGEIKGLARKTSYDVEVRAYSKSDLDYRYISLESNILSTTTK